MASHRVDQDSVPSHYHHIPYSLPHNANFINQERSAFEFGELEEAIALPGVQIHNHEIKQPLYATARPAATLEMFPSWPIRFQQDTPRGSSKSGEGSADSGSAVKAISSESPISMTNQPFLLDHQAADIRQNHQHHRLQPSEMEMAAGSGKGINSPAQPATKQNPEKRRGHGSNSEKVLDAKTLRRLAQNREAAKKSRLRKKAYVQQLESSRIRLAQLEQDLHRARSQGLFLGGGGVASGNTSTGGAIFDMEYARWLDDDHWHTTELRTALHAHLSDSDMRVIVDGCLSHYDELFTLKAVAARSDVFHLITGMWTTPAERCFLWMGGFRPSDLIKMLMAQLDLLTEQQVVGIYSLQQSSQQAEEALSQGFEQLQQSLVDTVASGYVSDTMHQMAVALGKLTNLEGFVRQADNLRQQTLHQLHRILTVRQAARCFLVIGEYYGRLRALSSLWASRPRETLMNDDNSCQAAAHLHTAQPSHSQFSNF